MRKLLGQDQIASSFGGFNEIIFNKNGKYIINPLLTKKTDLEIRKNLILIFAGVRKNYGTANDIARTFVNKLTTEKKKNILEIMEHTKMAKKLLNQKSFDEFGLLLNETEIKKRFKFICI